MVYKLPPLILVTYVWHVSQQYTNGTYQHRDNSVTFCLNTPKHSTFTTYVLLHTLLLRQFSLCLPLNSGPELPLTPAWSLYVIQNKTQIRQLLCHQGHRLASEVSWIETSISTDFTPLTVDVVLLSLSKWTNCNIRWIEYIARELQTEVDYNQGQWLHSM